MKDYIISIPELEKKELIILGDLNRDYLDTKDAGYSFLDEIICEFGVVQHIYNLRDGPMGELVS